MKIFQLITLSFFLAGCSANHPLWTGSSNSARQSSDSFTPRNAYERKVECNYQAAKIAVNEQKICYGPSIKVRYEQANCFSSMYRKFSANVCSPSLSVSTNSIAFMWRQLAYVYDPVNAKEFSANRRDKIWKDTLVLINDEEEYAFSKAAQEGREDRLANNEARANRNFERSMSFLGAQLNNSSRQNTMSNRTYILNGKIITCTTNQNITNCN